MRSSTWIRSLHAQATLWVVLPLLLIIVGIISAGIYTYQRSLSTLILSRHRQMANLAAVSVAQVMDSYADILSALASNSSFQADLGGAQAAALQQAGEAGEIFNAGLLLVDAQDNVRLLASDDLAFLGDNVSGLEVVQAVRRQLKPSYSSVLIDEAKGGAYVLIAVPLLTAQEDYRGAMIGGLNLRDAALSEPIQRLTVGFNGYAYLVDRNGIVISHPAADEIGQNYSSHPVVSNVISGQADEAVWDSPAEGQVVLASALVSNSGWGLVVTEPWTSVNEPIQFYGLIVGILGFAVLLITLVFSWTGVQRVTTPVRSLSERTALLESGQAIEPVAKSGIAEIDALGQAFLKMAEQVETYRLGLRKYLDMLTQSQEEERRRISRELHDETVQNLLSIHRHLEWLQATTKDAEPQAQLSHLQEIVEITLSGVRQISKDLRPLMLEDLGLVPALQALVRSGHQGRQAIPKAIFEVTGKPRKLSADLELALFRITQEALTNVRKHAQASCVQVNLHFQPKSVRLEIQDDGRGFEVPSSFAALPQQDSFGLMGIQERVWAAGGELSIDSAPREGTRLEVLLPVERKNGASPA